MNHKKICTACGTQYPYHLQHLILCPVCTDDRQAVPENGQSWTSLNLLSENHSLSIKSLTDHLYEFVMVPSFAIGQRALMVTTPNGNILWDCIALINEPTIEFIRSKGGLKAIAFSHPHYYTTMNEWAMTFNCPILIHEKDEPFIFHKSEYVSLWSGVEKELWHGLKLINIGGHFPGSSILLAPFLSGQGAILCGDTFYISPSKKHAAVMYSYPNRIPLPINEIQRIKRHMQGIDFDTLYGFYDYQNIYGDAKALIDRSLDRYV